MRNQPYLRRLAKTGMMPPEYYSLLPCWCAKWLQHYIDCPHVIRPGLTFVYHEPEAGVISSPQFRQVIAVHGDFVWLRIPGSRPYAKRKRELKYEYYRSECAHYEVIALTPEEAGEIAFGRPFLDANDPCGIWAAHLDRALDALDNIAYAGQVLSPPTIPRVADLPPGKLQTVEDGLGGWQTKFVIEEYEG